MDQRQASSSHAHSDFVLSFGYINPVLEAVLLQPLSLGVVEEFADVSERVICDHKADGEPGKVLRI